jgi:hypothetical protein
VCISKVAIFPMLIVERCIETSQGNLVFNRNKDAEAPTAKIFGDSRSTDPWWNNTVRLVSMLYEKSKHKTIVPLN